MSLTLLQSIEELCRPSRLAPKLIERVQEIIPVEEMLHARGKEYTKTGFYQLRVRPLDENISRDEVLYMLETYFKRVEGTSQVQINVLSRNSSKFGSVSFLLNDIDFDIVVARGHNGGELFEQLLIEKMGKEVDGNRGVSFEKGLLSNMDDCATGSGCDQQAKAALKALRDLDPAFRLNNISFIAPREGSTRRGKLAPHETAHIIADMVVGLKNGEKRYVSVKSILGKTLASFGVSKAFNDDLTVNTHSEEWQHWLQPFGLDPRKVEQGLKASAANSSVPWNDIDTTRFTVPKTHPIYRLMERMWGTGYYYLRQTRDGFKAFKVDKNFVDNELLKNLTVTQIRYPSKDRKQISIYLESKMMSFKIEARNPRGRGSSRPTQIQLTITKSTT